MSDSYECSYPYDGRHYLGHVVQLAERAIVIENACRSEMSIVMDVMCTIVAIGGCSNAFRLRVVVEGYGKHHWQINQYQQPCKP